jgi:uncharacterized protein YjiS (DUF1127 family)
MAQIETHTGIRAPEKQVSGSRSNPVAAMVAALRAWQSAGARRKALADLTPDQLRDIGYSEANRPILEVKAGLMTTLMSMR